MELTWNEQPLFLEQDVTVTLIAVDMDKRKLAFKWAEALQQGTH